jgi:hypothetical protein
MNLIVIECFRLTACSTSSLQVECNGTFETDLAGLAVAVYVIGVLYAFLGLAIICDDYFVVALEIISERLSLSEVRIVLFCGVSMFLNHSL